MPFSRFVSEGWDPKGFKQFGEQTAPLYLSAARRFLAGFAPWADVRSRHDVAVISILRLFEVPLPEAEVASVLHDAHDQAVARNGLHSLHQFAQIANRAIRARWDLLNVVDYALFRAYGDDRRFVRWLSAQPADVLDDWYRRFWPTAEPCDSRGRNLRLSRLKPMPQQIVSAFHDRAPAPAGDGTPGTDAGELLVTRTQQWLMNYHAVFMAPSSPAAFASQRARIWKARERISLRQGQSVHRAHVSPRSLAVSDAASGSEGTWAVRAHLLG